jgi:hypothetical protein
LVVASALFRANYMRHFTDRRSAGPASVVAYHPKRCGGVR